MTLTLCVIPGDGVGQEVVPAAVQVLQAVLSDLEIMEAKAGWGVFQSTGTALPEETVTAAQKAGAVLFGAVSSPLHPVEGYKSPIVALRRELDTFANIRPAKKWLTDSPLDLLVVRENTEGLYNSPEHVQILSDGSQRVMTERVMTETGAARVARLAFTMAAQSNRRVTIVHKANVIRQGDGLWRTTCLATARDLPTVTVDEGLVDAVAYHLIRTPDKYQLLLCPNLYGDILSDLASALADGLGMAPSLSLGDRFAIAEPVHGSAPDIAGQGVANPIAAILSGAMLCRYWWQRPEAAEAIEGAVSSTLAAGLRTPDIAQGEPTVGTAAITRAIIAQLV
jgi:homoisocitrate dehydrogenase